MTAAARGRLVDGRERRPTASRRAPAAAGAACRVASTIDAERALRADHQRGQVVAGDALHGAVPGADQPAVGEHDLEAEHRLAGDAVLGAEQAAGVRGDVAADGRDRAARRVGRAPEAALGRAAALRSPLRTPGSTTASSSSTEISSTRFMRSVESTSSPAPPMAPPASPVPAPRGTTGMPWARREAHASPARARRGRLDDGERRLRRDVARSGRRGPRSGVSGSVRSASPSSARSASSDTLCARPRWSCSEV